MALDPITAALQLGTEGVKLASQFKEAKAAKDTEKMKLIEAAIALKTAKVNASAAKVTANAEKSSKNATTIYVMLGVSVVAILGVLIYMQIKK